MNRASYLLISAAGNGCGHTLVTWAIARWLKERGARVGFLKPFGSHPVPVQDGGWSDSDAVLLKQELGLADTLERICPYPLSAQPAARPGLDLFLERITSAAAELSRGRDVLLIMGGKHVFFDDAAHGLSDVSLNAGLKADVLLVNRFRKISSTTYSVLSVKSLLRERLKGIIVNRVPPEQLPGVRETLESSFQRAELAVTGILPEDPVLGYRSVKEVVELLGGEVLWGEGLVEGAVGGMTVGTAGLGEDLRLFKRVYNKIILLRPATASETGGGQRFVAAILLTGGHRPTAQIVNAVKRAVVPLVVVQTDTFSALERLEETPELLSRQDEGKLHRFMEMLQEAGTFEHLASIIPAGPI